MSVGVNIPPRVRDFLTALADERDESRSETLTRLLDSLSDACGEWLNSAAQGWQVDRVKALGYVLSDYGRLYADPAMETTLRAPWETGEEEGGGP